MNFKILLSEILLIKIQPQIFVYFHNSLQKSPKNHEFFLKIYNVYKLIFSDFLDILKLNYKEF